MKNKLMLAITKIGDLLLENKITSLEEEPEWKDIYLDIPSYQRPYKWTMKNVNQLIDDIDESMKAGKRSIFIWKIRQLYGAKKDPPGAPGCCERGGKK